MLKRKIFISFDYEKDRIYRDLLRAWDANDEFDFSFNDCTPSEIQSNDFSRIKAGLTSKINKADIVLVIVGAECNKKHRDAEKIGSMNWQIFEIESAKSAGKSIVAVKLNRNNETPDCLYASGVSWAMSFTFESIKRALNNV